MKVQLAFKALLLCTNLVLRRLPLFIAVLQLASFEMLGPFGCLYDLLVEEAGGRFQEKTVWRTLRYVQYLP